MSGERQEVSYRLPVRWRLLVFAFMVGSLLSLPARLLREWRWPTRDSDLLFEPPDWAYVVYYVNFAACFFLLPFWNWLLLKDKPHVQVLGRLVWVIFLLLLVLAGLLFPSVGR
jgi:hypothetical protein